MIKSRLTLIVLPLLVLAGSLALLIAPETASAHALLSRSDPAQNAQLKASPTAVTAFFTEALDTHLSSLQVLDGNGKNVDNGTTTFGPDPTQMQIGIKGTPGPGYYTVVWQTLSAVDGHLFKGFYPFTVLTPDGKQPPGQAFQGVSTGGTTAQPDNVTARWGRLLGIAALVGSLAFLAFVVGPSLGEIDEPWRKRWRDQARKRVLQTSLISAAWLAIVAVAELYLQAHQVGGLSYLGDVLKNDWGLRWIQRQITLGVIVIALGLAYYLWKRDRQRLGNAAALVALIGGVVYIVLMALVSHGDSIPGSFWAVGADFLHILAASVWLGMLFQLGLFLLWLRQDIPTDTKADFQASHLQRFSTIAATSVVVLLATGVANAAAQIPDWSSLYDTAYGRALLLKLGIMFFLLLAAGANAFFLRPRIVDESDTGSSADDLRRRMSLAVRVELGLGIAVLCAAAILVLYPTARQVRDAEAFAQASTAAVVGYEQQQPAADGSMIVDFTASPGTVGPNSFRVFLLPQKTDINNILKVRMKFSYHTEDLGQAFVDMNSTELPNSFIAEGPYLSKAGRWDVDVIVERKGADDIDVTYPVAVAAPGAGNGQFTYPLTVGSWISVGAAVILVLALIIATWITEWPGRLPLPRVAPRFLRVTTATLTVLGTGILAISLIPGNSTGGVNPIKADAQSIGIGQTLYQQNCQMCHGIDGKGDGPAAASLPVKPYDLTQHVPLHSDTYFFGVIKYGLGTIMPAWGGQLSDNDIWNLINFLHSEFGHVPSPTPGSISSSSPTDTPAASTAPAATPIATQ